MEWIISFHYIPGLGVGDIVAPSLSIPLSSPQCQKEIVNGTHPVTKSEALQLSALQVQVDFGSWEEGKFKKGFLQSV